MTKPSRAVQVCQYFKHQAFSLVELVVVIGIIGMLIALLIPALSAARQDATSIQCASQLKQLGQAFAIYAVGNNGYLPPWSGTHAFPSGSYGPPLEDPGLGWTELLMSSYVSPKSAVYHCPAFQGQGVTYFIEARWEAIQGFHTMQLSQIRTASSFILSGDCTAPDWYPPPFGISNVPFDDVDKDDANSPCLTFPQDANGIAMHRHGNNILFGDMHVAQYMKWTPNEMTYSPDLQQSYDELTPD
jgi:prepilin-type N-terminal cleavage/methylation domain-containing protein